MPTPRLLKHWGGRWRLCKENLPQTVLDDIDLQKKVLLLVAHQFAHNNWGSKSPDQRWQEMNEYVYSLLEEHFEE